MTLYEQDIINQINAKVFSMQEETNGNTED